MSRNAFATLALTAGTALISASASHAALVHRYSFDGTANDSVGTANGTLAGAGTINGGRLVTAAQPIGPANTANGVVFPVGTNPSSSIVGGLTGSFTIQSIYTDAQTTPASFFHSIFGFYTDPTNALLGTSVRNEGPGFPSSVGFRQSGLNGGDELILLGQSGDQGTNINFIATYDASTGTASYYRNGALAQQSAVGALAGFNLQAISANAAIGNVPYNDRALNGSTDEFRVFNNSLNQAQVIALLALGANPTNAQLQAVVPEPASLGLLGLGGLALLRRRRSA